MNRIHIAFLSMAVALVAAIPMSAQRPSDYVNPLIGTDGMGHTFPGACAPFGIVQLSPDTDTIPHNVNGRYQERVYEYCAGYRYEDPTIVGFSHTHFSGTGHSDLGDVLVMPGTGDIRLNPGTVDRPEAATAPVSAMTARLPSPAITPSRWRITASVPR